MQVAKISESWRKPARGVRGVENTNTKCAEKLTKFNYL
jgi:hypothetical protein